ncbi:MAG: ankyrin repeat domain-containing protein [bacterium]|nr:ankyrin repeat domain-containing protein [bacterium]
MWTYKGWENLQLSEAESRFADYAETVRTLVRAGAPIDARNSLGNTTLMEAALSGDACWIRLLLSLGADPNATNDHYRETPLTAASHLGHPDAVRELIRGGANVNQPTQDGFTPLMCAAISTVAQCVYHLLEAGADADFVHPHGGFSALTLGVGAGLETDALVAIARKMRHPRIRREQVGQAIEEAQRRGRQDVVERLQAFLAR